MTAMDLLEACAPKPHDYPESPSDYIKECAQVLEDFRANKSYYFPLWWLEPTASLRPRISSAPSFAASARRSSRSVVPAIAPPRFWVTATMLIGVVSALLGVFVWQSVFALTTGHWGTEWPLLSWGIALSLVLLVTIAAGVRAKMTTS